MDIDIERLKVDESVWPDGAQWFGPDEGRFFAGFYKSQDGKVYFMSADDDEWQLIYPMPRRTIISRPKAPEAEWVDGLPPVGVECECLFNDGWCKVLVLAHHGSESWVERPRGTHVVSDGLGNKFRPIKSPHERQREELVELMEAEEENYFPKAVTAEDIADAILSKYNLGPKP